MCLTEQWVVRWGEWPRQRAQLVLKPLRLEVGRSLVGGPGGQVREHRDLVRESGSMRK